MAADRQSDSSRNLQEVMEAMAGQQRELAQAFVEGNQRFAEAFSEAFSDAFSQGTERFMQLVSEQQGQLSDMFSQGADPQRLMDLITEQQRQMTEAFASGGNVQTFIDAVTQQQSRLAEVFVEQGQRFMEAVAEQQRELGSRLMKAFGLSSGRDS